MITHGGIPTHVILNPEPNLRPIPGRASSAPSKPVRSHSTRTENHHLSAQSSKPLSTYGESHESPTNHVASTPHPEARPKLHHRRPQTVGGFKKCFGEQGQRHEIAATGLMNISAKSATDHFVYVYFVRLRLLCCNARCRKGSIRWGCKYLVPTLEASSIGLSNWMC